MEEIISFTNEIKNEITANINLDTEMKRSLLAAFIRVNGTIKFKNKNSARAYYRRKIYNSKKVIENE